MYEILKALSLDLGWIFKYGRSDFQNLFEEEEQPNKIHLFLDPVTTVKGRSDTGNTEKKTYSGAFLIVYSSDLDEESYESRYENYIKPIIDLEIAKIEKDLICNYKANFESWKETEIINVLDYNFDGVHIEYSISIEE